MAREETRRRSCLHVALAMIPPFAVVAGRVLGA